MPRNGSGRCIDWLGRPNCLASGSKHSFSSSRDIVHNKCDVTKTWAIYCNLRLFSENVVVENLESRSFRAVIGQPQMLTAQLGAGNTCTPLQVWPLEVSLWWNWYAAKQV